MLARQRLYGTKVGTVWAIFPDDVEAFKRTRRPAGRPRKLAAIVPDADLPEIALDVAEQRTQARTYRLLRKRGRRDQPA
jgi:hypothetical protein